MLDQLADRLTEARKNAKLTQEQAGKAIGRSHAALSAYEAGRALPPIPVLDQLCQLYRVRVSAVLGQDQPPGFPHVQPGGYAVADPNNPTRLTFWNKSPRPAEPPDPWPRRSPHPSPIINGDTRLRHVRPGFAAFDVADRGLAHGVQEVAPSRATRGRRSPARDEEPMGWPFRDIWLPPDVANSYRDSLVAFDEDGSPASTGPRRGRSAH